MAIGNFVQNEKGMKKVFSSNSMLLPTLRVTISRKVGKMQGQKFISLYIEKSFGIKFPIAD